MPSSKGDYCDCGNVTGELYMHRPRLWKSLGLTSNRPHLYRMLFEKARQTIQGF